MASVHYKLTVFQSTPPREGRPRTALASAVLLSFNPRPRARDDRMIG